MNEGLLKAQFGLSHLHSLGQCVCENILWRIYVFTTRDHSKITNASFERGSERKTKASMNRLGHVIFEWLPNNNERKFPVSRKQKNMGHF